jgi:hypothetical protein
MDSAFTLTLANIFMWKWEKQLVHCQSTKINLRSIPNPNDFLFVRSYILNRITTIDHQVASRMTKIIDLFQNDTIDDPLIRTLIEI